MKKVNIKEIEAIVEFKEEKKAREYAAFKQEFEDKVEKTRRERLQHIWKVFGLSDYEILNVEFHEFYVNFKMESAHGDMFLFRIEMNDTLRANHEDGDLSERILDDKLWVEITVTKISEAIVLFKEYVEQLPREFIYDRNKEDSEYFLITKSGKTSEKGKHSLAVTYGADEIMRLHHKWFVVPHNDFFPDDVILKKLDTCKKDYEDFKRREEQERERKEEEEKRREIQEEQDRIAQQEVYEKRQAEYREQMRLHELERMETARGAFDKFMELATEDELKWGMGHIYTQLIINIGEEEGWYHE